MLNVHLNPGRGGSSLVLEEANFFQLTMKLFYSNR